MSVKLYGKSNRLVAVSNQCVFFCNLLLNSLNLFFLTDCFEAKYSLVKLFLYCYV